VTKFHVTVLGRFYFCRPINGIKERTSGAEARMIYQASFGTVKLVPFPFVLFATVPSHSCPLLHEHAIAVGIEPVVLRHCVLVGAHHLSFSA